MRQRKAVPDRQELGLGVPWLHINNFTNPHETRPLYDPDEYTQGDSGITAKHTLLKYIVHITERINHPLVTQST